MFRPKVSERCGLKPLVLVTNRFDENLKLGLSQIKEAQVCYVEKIHHEPELLGKTQALILRSSTQVDKAFLKKAPKLQLVVTATSGFDHIDLMETQAKGIRVFHTPESQRVATAELTIAMMINMARKWSFAQKQLHKGEWNRSLLLGRQITGAHLGVIGFGRVGQEVAKRAQALGMRVSAYDPFIETDWPEGITPLGFGELMRSSDVVSLHVPKTKLTRHMIKKDSLEWMQPQASLLNMSRGDVVHEGDLIAHLLEHPEFTAGLDVFTREPLGADSPLLSLNNVCLTPHIGASTQEALRTSSQLSLEKVLGFFRGEEITGELPPKAPWYG